jgi:hypothetical protein
MLVSLAIAIAATTCAAAPTQAPARNDGLVQLPSHNLDEVYVRPDVNFQNYRKVIVDPGTVTMRKNWLKDINQTRGPSRWLYPSDEKEITDRAATNLPKTVAETFRTRGYEVVASPGPGVLRVTTRVTDLWINAPDVASPYTQALFSIDAGEATLKMEVRDAASGALLGEVVDRSTARQLSPRPNRTFSVTSDFWFDALFRQWTANSIASLESGQRSN